MRIAALQPKVAALCIAHSVKALPIPRLAPGRTLMACAETTPAKQWETRADCVAIVLSSEHDELVYVVIGPVTSRKYEST